MTTIVFDKTGTLTKGEFKVTDVITENGSKEELIELAALGEGYSNLQSQIPSVKLTEKSWI